METPLAIQDARPLTAPEVRAQVNLIQEVMSEVMKDGHHYGKIPGCGDKPTLLKPGAEKLLLTFRISVDPDVEDLSSEGVVRFRVRCRGLAEDGRFLGTGLGECSSGEDKYSWRAVICDEEWDATAEDCRRVKWRKSQGGAKYSVQQVRCNPADIANTVLKMAKKRALVDMVLSVTAASDIFTQDLEDDDHPREPGEKAPMKRPRAKAKAKAAPNGSGGEEVPNAISVPQGKRFYAIYKQAGKSDEEVKAHLQQTYGITSSKQITRDIYDEICKWAEAPSADEQGAPEPGGPDDIPY